MVGVPIQPSFGKERTGFIELMPQYTDGLKDLMDISHVYLLYHFDRHQDFKLVVRPYMDDDTLRGLFATRAPKRPNGIGLSIVEIVDINGHIITFRGVDMLNNTPLLDIKPYIAAMDRIDHTIGGWYEKTLSKRRLSDDRF